MSPSGRPGTAPRGTPRPALLAVLLAALALRLWHLGARSLWTDEGSTWTAATAPLHRLIQLCADKDASPPLYYLLTSLALRFGDGEAALRMVSVIASLGLVWLTYRLARLFAPPGTATLAAAITALSPYQLMYAQEARTYATVACLLVLSLFLFARTVVEGRSRTFLPYVLASALALYAQSIALLGVGVQAVFVVLEPRARRGFKRFVAGQLAAFALYLPWLLVTVRQSERLSQSHWYATAPDAHGVFHVLRAVFLSPVPLLTAGGRPSGLGALMPHPAGFALLLLLPALPLAAAAVAILRRRAGGEGARLAACGLVLPLLAVFLVSFKVPLWIPRYFVFLTPMLAALLALGIVEMRPRALGVVWAVLLLAIGAYACRLYDRHYTKEPWRDAVAEIARRSAPARAAALVTFDIDAFRFYDRRLGDPIAGFEVSHPDVPFASNYTPAQLDDMDRRSREHTRDFDQVWVVVRSPNSPVRKEVARRTEAVAAEGRVLVEREFMDSSGGPLRLAWFRRARGDSATGR
jgi:mannosyltransferase